MSEVAAFVAAAEEYCAWAEGEPRESVAEARLARRLVAELFRRAIELPHVESEIEAPEIPYEEWRRIYDRFGSLPVDMYSECFNPLVVPPEEPVVTHLADDLADLWRDLKGGLLLLRSGHVDAAVGQWRLQFTIHWGHHAAAALYALQSWFSDQMVDFDT
jgi:hypothetical protein